MPGTERDPFERLGDETQDTLRHRRPEEPSGEGCTSEIKFSFDTNLVSSGS